MTTTAEVRAYIAARPVERGIWSAVIVASLVAVLFISTAAFVWLLVVDLFVGCGVLGYLLLEERATVSERDAELAHADALITQLAAEAASAPVPFVPVEPVADESWMDEIAKPGGWA